MTQKTSGQQPRSAPPSLHRRLWTDARSFAVDNDYARALGYRWGRLLAAALVIVAIVVWSQGGFERAVDKPARPAAVQLQPGQPSDGGLYLVVPQSAWVSYARMNSADDSAQALAGTSYLMVAMQVTLQAKARSQGQELDKALVWLQRKGPNEAPEPVAPDDVLRDGDAVPLVLQPGLPTRVIARWAVRDSGYVPPREFLLGLKRFELVDKATRQMEPAWVETGPSGTWHLPLRDLRKLPAMEEAVP